GLALAGEFGDHCTTSLAAGLMVKSDCSQHSLFEGKTYCFGTEASKMAFDNAGNKQEIIDKAATFYAKNAGAERVKISQADAVEQIQSKACDLSNKDAGYLELDGMDLRHCKMVNVSFFGAYLRGANLSGANLQRAYLNLARLENADLSGADLTDAIIFQAIFDKTNFKGANLTNARVIGTLGNVDMSGATIRNGRFGLDIGNQPMGQMKFDSVGGNFANANFEGADLNIAAFPFGNLTGANLRNTNMHRADLSQADLTGADLTNANLDSAEVDGANFKGVKGLGTVKGFATVKGKCRDCAAK
ncbi:MAG TPA: pentapeptide repeat-containing protein, partial [Methylophilaceae bacterium]|nr:pentapeptide repeat-containing protein [Methylophilaceae bacterium]